MEHQTRTRRILLSSASIAAVCTLAFATSAMAQAADETKVDDVVVTARRAAIESATQIKKNADSVVDVIVADEAGKLPDNSVTEILQRVSGVSIVRFASLGDPDHFSAEGSGIQVRGLSGVAGRLNGREIFSSSGGRGLSWGDVTPELMAAVTVYKSPTADLIEGGTGGQIDLRTKLPFDFRKPTVGLTLNGSYGDLSGRVDLGTSFLAASQWDTSIGRIGAVVDLALNQYSSRADFLRMEPYYKTRVGTTDRFIPGGYTFGRDDFERTRTGIYGALAWRPSDTLDFYATAFSSKYETVGQGSGRFVTSKDLAPDLAGGNTADFDENGGLIRASRLYVRNPTTFAEQGGIINAGGNTGANRGSSVTTDFSVGFNWNSGQWGVKGALQAVDSTADRDSYDTFLNAPFPSSYGVDLSGDFPQVTTPASAAALFSNRTLYAWTATQPHNEHNKGHLYSGNLDAEYIFAEDGFFKSVKVGARYADRTERDLNNGYNWQALGAGWNGAPVHNAVEGPDPYAPGYIGSRPGDIMLGTFEDYFRGEATLPGETFLPSFSMVKKFDRAGDHAFYGNPQPAIPNYLPQHLTYNRTTTESIYSMVRFGSETMLPVKFSGNFGVRAVRYANTSEGFFTQPGNAPVIIDGVTRIPDNSGNNQRSDGLTYTKVLPSLNLTFEPTETIRVRAAANITLDNASFYALRASGNVGFSLTPNPNNPPPPAAQLPQVVTAYTTTSGNPRLKPMLSNNLDLTAEWYPDRGTTAHVSLFYKKLENVLVFAPAIIQVPIRYSTPTAETVFVNATSIDTINSTEDATIKGFELGGRTFFDQLPGLLSGFGVEANYTFIDSENPGDRYVDINGAIRSDLPFIGLSKHNYNLTLLYEKDKVSARVAYNYRSEYLMGTNGNGTNGDYNYRSGPGASTFVDISLPNYSDDYGTVDAGVTYRLNERVSMSLEGSNLTNEVTNTLMGGYNNGQKYIRSWFVSDRRTNVTIRLSY